MAIGVKVGKNDQEADRVAWIRTMIVLLAVACEIVIIASNVRHW